MAKIKRNIIITLLSCLALAVFAFGGKGYSPIEAEAEETQLSLKSGNYAEWIDRVNFGTYKTDARKFYDWLVENTDGDGVDDALIDPTDAEIFEIRDNENNKTGDIEYVYTFKAYDKSVNSTSALYAETAQNETICREIMTTVYGAFNRDQPQVFWLNGVLQYGQYWEASQSDSTITYHQEIFFIIKSDAKNHDIRQEFFATEEEIRTAIAAMNEKVDEIVGGIEEDASEYEKVKYFNYYLTHNNSYRADPIEKQSYICYFALFGRDGQSIEAPVCEGYARSMKVLCDKAGVDCILEDGDAGGPHMWNVIKVDGKWYNTDVTWNDPGSGGNKVSGMEREIYLLVGSETVVSGKTFAASHVAENSCYANIVAFTNSPKISTQKYDPGIVDSWDVSDESGTDDVTATLYKAKGYTESNPVYDLVISGSGKMKDYNINSVLPWKDYAADIVTISVRSKITKVGDYAFKGFDSLTQIEFASWETLADVDAFNGIPSNVTVKLHDGSYISQHQSEYTLTIVSLCEYTWSQQSPASCTSAEILEGVCSVCNNNTTKDGEAKLDHVYNSYGYSDDEHWKVCACEATTAPTSHSFGNWSETKKPTVDEYGEESRSCVCGKVETREIDKIIIENESSSGGNGNAGEESKESSGGSLDNVVEKPKGCKNSIGGVGLLGLVAFAFGVINLKKKN